ncbi:MAG TPA: hypothetical protein VMU30_09980 [Bacteroidota bacterium]|nr:hypothetical protein [Bacteroidota bacterium]
MNTLKYETTVHSDTVRILGLEKFSGKKVEIVVTEKSEPNEKELSSFFSLAGNINIDEESVCSLREISKL